MITNPNSRGQMEGHQSGQSPGSVLRAQIWRLVLQQGPGLGTYMSACAETDWQLKNKTNPSQTAAIQLQYHCLKANIIANSKPSTIQ